MKLSKTIIFNSSARPFGQKEEIEINLTREEQYELQLMQIPLYQMYLIPDQLEDYAYGRLLIDGIIQSKDDVTSMRICDANRYYIQLKMELNDKIHKAGSLHDYINSRPKEGWGDIVAVRSASSFTDISFEDEQLSALATQAYYAAVIENGSIKHLAYDISPENALYKLYGAQQSAEGGFVLTNGRPTSETMWIIYKMRAPMAVCLGRPTNGAVNIAKKAGITLVSDGLIYADTARRLAQS